MTKAREWSAIFPLARWEVFSDQVRDRRIEPENVLKSDGREYPTHVAAMRAGAGQYGWVGIANAREPEFHVYRTEGGGYKFSDATLGAGETVNGIQKNSFLNSYMPGRTIVGDAHGHCQFPPETSGSDQVVAGRLWVADNKGEFPYAPYVDDPGTTRLFIFGQEGDKNRLIEMLKDESIKDWGPFGDRF